MQTPWSGEEFSTWKTLKMSAEHSPHLMKGETEAEGERARYSGSHSHEAGDWAAGQSHVVLKEPRALLVTPEHRLDRGVGSSHSDSKPSLWLPVTCPTQDDVLGRQLLHLQPEHAHCAAQDLNANCP